MMAHMRLFFYLCLSTFFMVACDNQAGQATAVAIPTPTTTTTATTAVADAEYPITLIELTKPLTKKKAELSGLAWYGDTLILLPQYPDFNEDGSFLYALAKADILAYLDGTTTAALRAQAIPFVAPGLADTIAGFEGYEALAFVDDTIYLTIEADTQAGMRGYLVRGTIAPDLSAIRLDTAVTTTILPQSSGKGRSEEALLITENGLLTLHEANGAELARKPVAHQFEHDLTPAGEIPFPSIEYRLTDATAVDGNGRFWAINYSSGSDKFQTDSDLIAQQFGLGPTHSQYAHVERLIEFELTDNLIRLSGQPPIQLTLITKEARKWEGIVRLDERGFLLVTDKSPDTLLAFVNTRPE